MKLNVHDIDAEGRAFSGDEPVDSLNAELVHGAVRDFEFSDRPHVELQCQRNGEDIVCTGQLTGAVIGHCARCLEPYPFSLTSDVAFVFVRRHEPAPAADSDDEDDGELSYYAGDEIDLTPLLRERLILALPTLPLCADECRGLCPQCGINRNDRSCECSERAPDPRLAVLRNLKIDR